MKSLVDASLDTEAATQTSPFSTTPPSPSASEGGASFRRPQKRQLDYGLGLESIPERKSDCKRTKTTRFGLVEYGTEGLTPELTVQDSSAFKVDYRVQRKIGNVSKMAADVMNLVDHLLTEVGNLKSLCETK